MLENYCALSFAPLSLTAVVDILLLTGDLNADTYLISQCSGWLSQILKSHLEENICLIAETNNLMRLNLCPNCSEFPASAPPHLFTRLSSQSSEHHRII